eukprot:scaffold11578_cov109-Phaeocystis_antarctica.AAC.3
MQQPTDWHREGCVLLRPRGWANGAGEPDGYPRCHHLVPLPYPGTLRWQAGARDGRVGVVGGSQHRVGDWALRERGPPKPVPGLGSHTRLVPGAVRLRATLKAFRAAPPGCQARLLHWIKAAEAKKGMGVRWVSMTSSKILGATQVHLEAVRTSPLAALAALQVLQWHDTLCLVLWDLATPRTGASEAVGEHTPMEQLLSEAFAEFGFEEPAEVPGSVYVGRCPKETVPRW